MPLWRFRRQENETSIVCRVLRVGDGYEVCLTTDGITQRGRCRTMVGALKLANRLLSGLLQDEWARSHSNGNETNQGLLPATPPPA